MSEIPANLPKISPRNAGDCLPTARHEISTSGTLYDYGSHLFRISGEDKRRAKGTEEADFGFPHLKRYGFEWKVNKSLFGSELSQLSPRQITTGEILRSLKHGRA